jgi:hypothetical protein
MLAAFTRGDHLDGAFLQLVPISLTGIHSLARGSVSLHAAQNHDALRYGETLLHARAISMCTPFLHHRLVFHMPSVCKDQAVSYANVAVTDIDRQ